MKEIADCATPRFRRGEAIPGFVHVDLDGFWTLPQGYGFPEGETFERDPIYRFALARLLDLLDDLSIKATFFIVGRDLEIESKREAVREIAARGHELACHGYWHMIGMENLTGRMLEREIVSARDALTELTGAAPRGFRAPGYGCGPRTLEAIADAGFAYDGSFLPVPWWVGAALRFAAQGLRRKVARELHHAPDSIPEARGQYGGAAVWREIHRSHPELAGRIAVIPISVTPRLGLPMHASLGSAMLGQQRVLDAIKNLRAYMAIAFGRRYIDPGVPPVYLLHGMDAAAPEDYRGLLPKCLERHRGFSTPLETRMRFLNNVLGCFKEQFKIQRTDEWVDEVD